MKASSLRSTLLPLLSLLLATAACGPGTPEQPAEQPSEQEARPGLTGALIIDVRTRPEYDAGHIDGAILIPYDVIAEQVADHTTDKQQQIVVYCRSGRRAGIAQQQLLEMGYVHVENAGSLAAARRRLEPEKTGN